MGHGVTVGKVLGIEIRLDYSWFLVFAFFSWQLSVGLFPNEYQFGPAISWLLGITAALLLFASVLIHELSHALMARRYGIEVQGITLFLFGGVAQIKGEPERPGQEFAIAAVGPLTSIVLGAGSLALMWLAAVWNLGTLAALFNYLGWINIGLALFNLIPGFPMDGGRILRSAMWKATGNLEGATRWASYTGRAVGWLMIGYGLYLFLHPQIGGFGALWLVFIGWFLNNAAASAYSQLVMRRTLITVPVTEALAQDVPGVDWDLRVRDFVNGYLLRYDHPYYPVWRDGEITGLVTVDEVRKLDREYWGVTAVGAIALPLEEEPAVESGENAWDAVMELLDTDAPRLLVLQNGRLRGVITRESISSLLERQKLFGRSRRGARKEARRIPVRKRQAV